jgi:1-phosphatidylinositol phosphodiesterase
MSITRQLEEGIRYFDIRGGFNKYQVFGTPQLVVFHGFYQVGTALLDIFQEMYDFLGRPTNKFECLVVQIKQDYGTGDVQVEEQFATAIQTLIGQAAVGQWRVASTNPKLGDLRGKIQLVRRFRVPNGLTDFGISVNQGWTDNSPSVQLVNTTVTIRVQDHWNLDNFDEIPTKFQLITAHLTAAAAEQNMDVWYLNFASATVPSSIGQAQDVALGMTVEDPDGIGVPVVRGGINKPLSTFFNNSAVPLRRYGFVLMDYPGDPAELLLAIVRMNFP